MSASFLWQRVIFIANLGIISYGFLIKHTHTQAQQVWLPKYILLLSLLHQKVWFVLEATLVSAPLGAIVWARFVVKPCCCCVHLESDSDSDTDSDTKLGLPLSAAGRKLCKLRKFVQQMDKCISKEVFYICCKSFLPLECITQNGNTRIE